MSAFADQEWNLWPLFVPGGAPLYSLGAVLTACLIGALAGPLPLASYGLSGDLIASCLPLARLIQQRDRLFGQLQLCCGDEILKLFQAGGAGDRGRNAGAGDQPG